MDSEVIVLLAEDNKVVRRTMSGLLSAVLPNTFKVITAEDGEQACALIREFRGRIAMVITDYHMPGVNGEGVIKAAIDQQVHKILLCSGGESSLQGVFKLVSQVQTMRFQYLQKPISLNELEAAILPLLANN